MAFPQEASEYNLHSTHFADTPIMPLDITIYSRLQTWFGQSSTSMNPSTLQSQHRSLGPPDPAWPHSRPRSDSEQASDARARSLSDVEIEAHGIK